MKAKLFWIVAVIVIMAMALSACTPEAPAADIQDGKPIRFLSPNRQHPVVRTMALGFFDACEKLGVKCVDNSFDGVDFSLMVPAVDIAINEGSSGIIPFTDKAVIEQDMRLIEAGIPSCIIHGKLDPVEFPGYLCWVAADAGDYARRAADALGEKLGGKGVIAITQGDLNDVENLVSAEFKKQMASKYPEIVVLDPQMEGFDQPAAIGVISSILQANPEITGVFGTTGNSAANWAAAVKQTGLEPGSIAIMGMDYTRPNLDLVKSGEVFALVGQPLYEETYRAVELLVANLKGEKVAYDNVYPAPIITKDNVDEYYTYADRVDAQDK